MKKKEKVETVECPWCAGRIKKDHDPRQYGEHQVPPPESFLDHIVGCKWLDDHEITDENSNNGNHFHKDNEGRNESV